MNIDTRTAHLLTAPPLPLLLRMATPNTVAFFIQGSVSLAEVWFIGQLGSASLAAIALSFPILMLVQTISGGAVGGAVASSIARALGAAQTQRAEQLIWHALAIAVIAAAAFLGVFLLAGKAFLTFLGGQGAALAQAYEYSLVLLGGGLFIWLLGILTAVFRGMGDMQFPALMMIISAAIQIPLSGGLVLGLFGLPAMGVVGAAVSAVVSGLIISLVLIVKLTWGRNLVCLRRHQLTFQRELFNDILGVAIPASMSPMLTVGTVICLTALVARFGEAALAGYGVGSRVEFLIIPLVFGLGAAMTSLVGMSIGAGDIQRAERVGWIGGLSAGAMAGTVGIILALFPDAWIRVFSDDPAVIEAARSYIQIVGPCFAFHGLGLSLYFASQGANAMLWPLLGTILRVIVAAGGAFVAVVMLQGSLESIYTAAACGMVAYALVMILALKFGAWRPSPSS